MLFDQRTTTEDAEENVLPKIEEVEGDEEMEVASDDDRKMFDTNDLDNELNMFK